MSAGETVEETRARKTHAAMRARVDAAAERDALAAPVSEVRDVPPILRALEGRAADATLPAGMAPGPVVLASFADSTGGVLQVERDDRDGIRHFITAAFDDSEGLVEVSPAVARGLASLLASDIVRGVGSPADVEPVKQPSRAVQQGMAADVENDGDRGPRERAFCGEDPAVTRARAVFADVARALPVEWIAVATWALQRLPTLRERVRAIKLANSEPVYQADGVTPTANTYTATTSEETALASLWRAVLDVSRHIDPHRDVRREGPR